MQTLHRCNNSFLTKQTLMYTIPCQYMCVWSLTIHARRNQQNNTGSTRNRTACRESIVSMNPGCSRTADGGCVRWYE